MAPVYIFPRQAVPTPQGGNDDWNWRKSASSEDLVIESWSQGLVVGSLMLMSCITVANMRRGILLHKLILAEQLMALTHGTFCFFNFKGYGWYLSSTATLLYLSYIMHNVVAWLKVKPFFHGKSTIFEPGFVRWTIRIYLSSLACTVPIILFQISDNFRFFNGYGGWYKDIRPYEPLMRDPWWIFCCGILFYVISKSYGMGVLVIIKKSPRFGILFVSIILAVIFTVLDVVASIHSFIGSTDGINPFWKLSLVFKCLTDAILLDDFKTELKRLGLKRIKRDEKRRESVAITLDDDVRYDSDEEARMNFSNGAANGSINSHAYQQPITNGRPKSNDNVEGAEEVEFLQALNTHPSQLSSDRESRRGSSIRPQVGRGGLPATRLPQLFHAIKPGKRRKESEADTEASRNDSIWTLPDEETESQNKKSKKKARDDDDIAPDEIRFEDNTLEEARRMNERTIAELTRRKQSAAGTSTSPEILGSAKQKKPNSSRNFWDGIDDLDDDDDDDDYDGPSSSHHA